MNASNIREAFLAEASEWRAYADSAEHPTNRAIGLVITEAMENAAKKYKHVEEVQNDENTGTTP